MTSISREVLFVREGVSPKVVKIAAEASCIPPKERTEAQREAVSLVSQKIAENNQRLAD